MQYQFFDTAKMYSLGDVEALLGHAIESRGPPYHGICISIDVAARAPAIMNDQPKWDGHSRVHWLNKFDASLPQLQRDRIDP